MSDSTPAVCEIHAPVYYNLTTDNFYCGHCRKGMGLDFWNAHKNEWHKFPATAEKALADDALAKANAILRGEEQTP